MVQRQIDFKAIIEKAWAAYDPSREIKGIEDISARVSTNHVYRAIFHNDTSIIAKLSYFGKFEHFTEDHTIINALSINLPHPYENFLARSLTKNGKIFFYRYQDGLLDAWVVFYNPVKTHRQPSKRQSFTEIVKLGQELAKFHDATASVKNTLPKHTKTLVSDINHLLEIIDTPEGQFEHRGYIDNIKRQCDLFLENSEALGISTMTQLPVFVDWNIGNFSLTDHYSLYSRWDYDWFRVTNRVLDFYFFSKVCSSIGDRTIFNYKIDYLMEERFMVFLRSYHETSPLSVNEIRFMKEAYRFFILNYVVKDGRYFFHEIYANRLLKEAHETYFPRLDIDFDEQKILKALNL